MTLYRRREGFSAPRTAGGRSSLVEPFRYLSCSSHDVTFRADPERIRRFLPLGLEPLENGQGRGIAGGLTRAAASHSDLLWRSLRCTQYKECVVGFIARYGDRVGRYTALVWVDSDWSQGMAAIFGWRKRLATVVRTHLHSINPAVPEMSLSRRQAGAMNRNLFFASEQEDLDELGKAEVIDGFSYDRGWTTAQAAVPLRDYAAAEQA